MIGMVLFILTLEVMKEWLVFTLLEPFLFQRFPEDQAEVAAELSEYILTAILLVPFGYLFVVRPVRLSNQILTRQEQRFDKLVASMSDGFGIVDKQGVCQYANDSFNRMLGIENSELVGNPVHKFLTPASKDKLREELKIRHQGASSIYELTWQKPDGSQCVTITAATPLYDTQNRIYGSFAVLTDITQRKIMEEELREAKNKAESANEAKSIFLSRMSHELRTPLNAILGFAQVQAYYFDADQVPDIAECQQQIELAGNHLLALIDDILDLVKIERNLIDVPLESVDIDQVVKRSIDLVKAQADSAGITILFRKSALQVQANTQRLAQVLINLLTNAIKYNKPHGQVRISVEKCADNLVIAIADTGVGMTKEDQQSIFEPFHRLYYATKNEVQGTGIGLSVVKHLIERMGGEIFVESALGRGSEFRISLPYGENHSVVIETGVKPGDGAVELTPVTVVCIDDNWMSTKLMEKILEPLPQVSLYVSNSPTDGLALIQEKQPQLVFLDINMPEMSGIEILKRLRDEVRCKTTRFVAVTANAMPDEVAKALDIGFDQYLTKPLDINKVREEVAAIQKRGDN